MQSRISPRDNGTLSPKLFRLFAQSVRMSTKLRPHETFHETLTTGSAAFRLILKPVLLFLARLLYAGRQSWASVPTTNPRAFGVPLGSLPCTHSLVSLFSES